MATLTAHWGLERVCVVIGKKVLKISRLKIVSMLSINGMYPCLKDGEHTGPWIGR